jgi:hypothetical protein
MAKEIEKETQYVAVIELNFEEEHAFAYRKAHQVQQMEEQFAEVDLLLVSDSRVVSENESFWVEQLLHSQIAGVKHFYVEIEMALLLLEEVFV